MTASIRSAAALALLSAACVAPPPAPSPEPTASVDLARAPVATETPSTEAPSAEVARVDALFARWDSATTPGAAVAVVRDGELVLARGYGRASLEHEAPITPRTPFHAASLSKQFTAFAVAVLAERGRIDLDEDVRAYLPELPDLGRRITVRHLVHHTSGLRDQWDLLMVAGWRLDDVITREQILSLVGRQRGLNFEPGAEYAYSNTGYTLLAEIVSRVTGEPFPAWMRTNVFLPLGMTSTHFHDDPGHVVPGRAHSYSLAEGGGYRNEGLSYATVGATSLFTTAEDLARWIANLETGRVGGAAVRMLTRERGVLASGDTIAYGFALAHGTYRGAPMLQHTGSDAGFRSVMAYFPEQRVGMVVLGNVSTLDLGGALRGLIGTYLADELAPVPPRAAPAALAAPAEDEAAPAALAAPERYAGTYASEELATSYEVAVVDGGLVLRHPRHGEMPLAPRPDGEFAVTLPGTEEGYFRVGFDHDGAGRATGLRFSTDRTRALVFERR